MFDTITRQIDAIAVWSLKWTRKENTDSAKKERESFKLLSVRQNAQGDPKGGWIGSENFFANC